MAVKLLSFLGTGKYEPVNYYLKQPDQGYQSPYVQESLMHLIKDAELLLFTTTGATNKHWDILKERLSESLKGEETNYQNIWIPDGHSEGEMWQIFNIVNEVIEENDTIYIDVTHSFRSIPFIIMSIINYTKVLKNIRVEKIYYGAYEARVGLDAPIIDLTFFDQLNDWSTGISQLLMTGNQSYLTNNAKRIIQPMRRATKGRNEGLNQAKYIIDAIDRFYSDLSLNRGKSIQGNLVKLVENIELIKSFNESEMNYIKPIYNLLEKIVKQVGFYQDNLVEDVLGFVELCRDFKLYQQAYTYLEENVLNYICTEVGYEIYSYNSSRKLIEKGMYRLYGLNKHDMVDDYESSERELLDQLRIITTEEMFIYRENIKRFRNDLNHASFREENSDAKRIISELDTMIIDFRRLFIEPKIEETITK